MEETCDLLCISPHSDDAEIGLGGTLRLLGEKGRRVWVADLTRGELGSNATPDERWAEAGRATRTLGLTGRAQLQLPDGFVSAEDPDQLEQALINLVRNAVDATLEAEGSRVSLTWTVQSDKLDLLVEDEGPGLADTGNLFVPFYTTKQGGSGIGLVLSRQIAEGHAGTLELENREGGGARARMILPCDPEA